MRKSGNLYVFVSLSETKWNFVCFCEYECETKWKEMAEKPTKPLSGSHFEFEELYSSTNHPLNILVTKLIGNDMSHRKVG